MADDTDDALRKHRDLLIACGWGKEVDVILLFQQGASVRVQDQDGKNCLHYSSCKGHVQVTNLLIENGCAVNAKDKCNRTPLHLAAEEGHHDIVSILLSNGAEFDVQDEDGYSPCHVACLNDHSEVLELFIQWKVDLTLKSKEGLTPLHIAAVNGSVKTISLLVKAGVGPSPQDLQGNTPLHLAVQAKSLKAVKCLVKHEANVNIQNYDGDTALHLCADLGYIQFAEQILNSNQPIELSPNNVGDTAKDIAIRHGFREIVQLIPDPARTKKKSKRRTPYSDSPVESVQNSTHTSPKNEKKEVVISPRHKHYQSSVLGSPPGFLQHPSEEVPTATSSSVLSLWVPTTDSGISLPMDNKGDNEASNSSTLRRKQKKNQDKSAIIADLKLRHNKKEKVHIHEYDELRHDPRFIGTKTGSPKKTPKSSPRHTSKEDYLSRTIPVPPPVTTFHNGAISDESVQYKGCFFKTKQKNQVNRRTSARNHRKHSEDHEKEIMMQRQAELYYQLNESKTSLEKQMRKMRKKFEKALLATDTRFLEQKKREEAFHNQLRTELEIIESSLERGSKKNVEEFTSHIKNELNNLAERLTGGCLDLNSADQVINGSANSICNKMNNRQSGVDLDKDISVSLTKNHNNNNIHSNHGNHHTHNGTLSRGKTKMSNNTYQRQGSKDVHNEDRIREMYEQRLKDLEQEVKQKATKEKENEELRARVQELEQLIKGGGADNKPMSLTSSSTAVT